MGKSGNHRKENTYKFQPFSERINNIRIDVVHRIRHYDDQPEEQSTYFSEAFQRWTELNCTEDFSNFKKEISNQINTFAQLVHHEDLIVDALKKHLQVPNSSAMDALLDLVVQLARDLQTDFYKHFKDFFDILVSCLNVSLQNVELLENIFSCLAFLFKFLWRYLVRDIREVFSFFSPLLDKKCKQYVRNFAAESFAFLMRKVKDHSSLFNFMFATLETEAHTAEGIGRLMFEMIKGVMKQFHSSTQKLLPILISKLGPVEGSDCPMLPWSNVATALSSTMTSICQYTSKDNAAVIWSTLLAALEELHSLYKKTKTITKRNTFETIGRLLQLILILLQYKKGLIVSNPDGVAKVFISVLKTTDFPEFKGASILDVTLELLLSCHSQLSIENTAKLTSLVYENTFSCSAVFNFTKKLFHLPCFEKDVLPPLLIFCNSNISTGSVKNKQCVLQIITELVLWKCPLPKDASAIENYNSYLLDFTAILKSKKQSNFPHYIASILEKSGEKDSLKEHNLTKLWCSLVCLPNVSPMIEKEKIVSKIQKLLKSIDVILEEKSIEMKEKFLFLSWQCIYCCFLLQEDEELFDWISIGKIIELLVTHTSDIHALRIGDLYFTSASNVGRDDVLSDEVFQKIFSSLSTNLSSSDSKIRLLTLRILSQFELPLPFIEDAKQVGVFQICLEAEKVPASVLEYRRKLIYLQKLEYSTVQIQIPQGRFSQVPLRYLIGMLFCNLNLLWNPVNKLIASHAEGLNKEEFWEIFEQQLLFAANRSEITLQNASSNVKQTTILKKTASTSDEEAEVDISYLFTASFENMSSAESKPDFVTFRIQLWKSMQIFAEQCEPKSRILSPLLMKFLSDEYFPADLMICQSQNIRQPDSSINTADTMDIENTQSDEETDELQEETKVKRKAATKSLLAHLELFALFKNPHSLFMEPKLKELYLDLLLHKDYNVQKTAFQCLMTYNSPSLMPYRENFERLMDDKTFKDEISLFSVNHEQNTISAEHRPDVLPVLMRILFGKMNAKSGKNTSRKKQSDFRKSIIFRFLTGCSKEELQTFVGIVFSPCRDLLTDNPHEKILQIKNSVDIQCVFPLKRIKGVLNTIGILCDKMGYQLEYFLPSLLQIIMGLLSIVVACLDQREQISSGVRNILKNLRQLGIARIIQFFEEFEKYEFSRNEIDAVFEAAVWPQLDRLPSEGLVSPTPLIKLLNVWAINRRYVSLLAKHHPDDQSMSPLPYVFSLLASNNLRSSVALMIINMVECLLSQPDEENSSNVEMLKVNGMDAIDISSLSESEAVLAIPFTAGLVIPHVPKILSYIKMSIKSLKHRLKKNAKSPEIHVLSMLSIYITDPEQCSDLVSLLFPFLSKDVSTSLEMEIDILRSVLNLLKMTTDCQKFFRPIGKLFSTTLHRKSRSLLCDTFKLVSTGHETLEKIADLTSQINSWDKKRVEEPDYMCRLGAFKSINILVQQMSVLNLNLIIPIVHNCCYFILNVDDMSLRDSSTHCLNVIIKQLRVLNVNENCFQELVCQTILGFTKVGVKSKSESVRHDCISILASVAENFPKHPHCEDLAAVQDKDAEADFFENMKHIQIHNRTRALRRLIRYLSSHQMKEKSLLNYFLPMSTVFLTDITFKKRSDLIDAAIDAVGAICKQLTWQHYYKKLNYFLKLLSKKYDLQKVIVRVIVSILDSFHFDLACSTFEVNFTPKQVKGTGDSKNEENNSTSHTAEKGMDLEEAVQPSEKSVKLATCVHRAITMKLLPELNRSITRKVKSDTEHKLVKSKYAEDDEILRVPIAIAIVRLLQHLPQKSLELNLPGILIKVCTFLKSRSIDIRQVARGTLVKIMASLGARYFPYLLNEMRSYLKRGYQLHVLCFTIYTLLKNLSTVLKPGDLDSCIGSLTEICNEELFGQVAEEKDVKEIAVMEAKVNKSYDTYGFLAKYIGSSSLSILIQPLKQVLDTTHSNKTARKVLEALRQISLGLLENTSLTIETLMVFIHGLTKETLPLLEQTEKNKSLKEEVTDSRLQPPSCYLLSKELHRDGEKPKASKETNSHILIEFGLQLLHLCLKKSLLVPKEESHRKLLDPFVKIFSECLFSKHIKINSFCLRCLCWILKFPLPALNEHIKKIASGMFVLLKNYASAGAAKGDNFELVFMCFKAVTIMIRNVNIYKVEEDQLHVLLTFCEEDIYDHHRQSSAFNLLRAILSRKLNVPQLRELIDKVENMSITSESPHVRLQCRQVVLQYILDFPLGKKLEKHIEFYLSQLSYDTDTGRESALEMLATMFSSFPLDILTEYSGLFFVPISIALVNDESSRCRKLIALAIKSLLEKMDHNTRNSLFGLTVNWFEDKLLRHKNLAAQVTGLFVEVEAGKFERHLSTLLPILNTELEPSKYNKNAVGTESVQHDADHLLFNLLNTLIKLLRECQIIRDVKYSHTMCVIFECVHTHLLHPHNWVRLASAQLLGMLFGHYTAEELSCMVKEKEPSQRKNKEYLFINTLDKLKSLVHCSVMQLQSRYLDENFSNQIVKNLVFLAKVVKNLTQQKKEENMENEEGDNHQVNLNWMVSKIIREANYEAINQPKIIVRRVAVFKWIAAVCIDLGPELLPTVLHVMLPPLQRETSASSKENALRTLGLEVIEILKKVMDTETFTSIYAEIYNMRSDRKESRKRKRAVDAVSHPDVAAKRRVKKNISKKESKKRKISEMRPSKNVKQLKRLKKSKN